MGEIIIKIIIGIMVLLGGGSVAYIVVALPATIIYKLVHLTKGYKFTD